MMKVLSNFLILASIQHVIVEKIYAIESVETKSTNSENSDTDIEKNEIQLKIEKEYKLGRKGSIGDVESKEIAAKESKNQKSHNAPALLIHCADFRLVESTRDFMEKLRLKDWYDDLGMAGTALTFNKKSLESLGDSSKELSAWSDSILSQAKILIGLHGIKRIILLDHMGCGAYRKVFKDINQANDDDEKLKIERKHHIDCLKNGVQAMKEIQNQIKEGENKIKEEKDNHSHEEKKTHHESYKNQLENGDIKIEAWLIDLNGMARNVTKEVEENNNFENENH